MRGHVRRFSTFAAVGVINTAVDLAFFVLFSVGLGLQLVVANILAFMVAAANSYVLNRTVTFADRVGSTGLVVSSMTFLGVALGTLALSSAVILALSPILHPVFAKVIASSTNVVVGYIGSNYLVFLKQEE